MRKRFLSKPCNSQRVKGKIMQTQYNVLGYRIDLYFYDYELAIVIDKNGHSDRNIQFN